MLEPISKTQPDLILPDIMMSGLTTKEIFKEMNKRNINTPVIFLTVVRQSEEIRHISHQVADYIEKPFEVNDLVKRIKAVLKIR